MAANHTKSIPKTFPFHSDSFTWDHFERFCLGWMVSGTTLPNLTMTCNEGPNRLGVMDAIRLGNPGEKQHGIDLLLTMGNGAKWVVQCKHVDKFGKPDADRVIEKAKREFGPYNPAHHLIWVTGKVTKDASLRVIREEQFTLWSAERITLEVLQHTPPGPCRQLIRNCFGPDWAKVFFPVGDELLLTEEEFYSRWNVAGRSFHHRANLTGRHSELEALTRFARAETAHKVLILSAAGGVGKSRLLREVAHKGEASGRAVRFVNPNARESADLPVFQEVARTTIIHDDAHRMDLRREILNALAQKDAQGMRLILSTRPGAESSLRKRIMDAGGAASEILECKLSRLSKAELAALAESILGDGHEEAARRLAALSDGCALVTLVGAELLRTGQIHNLDLLSSQLFRDEVFARLEEQELAHISTSMSPSSRTMFLRTMALLSPWPSHEPERMKEMAKFLELPRFELATTCDELRQAGLLIRTREGLRIAPDLFADHLVYCACYDRNGRATDFIHNVLEHFKAEFGTLLQNLSEAEWRATQQHGRKAEGILEPIWNLFLREYKDGSFWELAQMLERWGHLAVFQPSRTLILVQNIMKLDGANSKTGFESINSHEHLLAKLLLLLKHVATWCNDYREHALDLLLKLHHMRPEVSYSSVQKPFAEIAEVAKYEANFPDAPNGVLTWLEQFVDRPEGRLLLEEPSKFWEVVLCPIFARYVNKVFSKDEATIVMESLPVSVKITRPFRDRAFRLIAEKIIPKSSVAAINALPALGGALENNALPGQRSPSLERLWQPVEEKAFRVLKETAQRYPHPLVHFVIRRMLRQYVVYKYRRSKRDTARQIIESMPDTWEHRLARITLAYSRDDSLTPNESMTDSMCIEQADREWRALVKDTVCQLVARNTRGEVLHAFLAGWHSECLRHGLRPRFHEICFELSNEHPCLARQLLECLLTIPESPLHAQAANLLGPFGGAPDSEMARIIELGFSSRSPEVVTSFISRISREECLHTKANIDLICSAARLAHGAVVPSLIEVIKYTKTHSWTADFATNLLDAELPDHALLEIAEGVTHAMSYQAWKPGLELITRLLRRLERVPSLPWQRKSREFLEVLANSHPRLVLEFFRNRIAIEEHMLENNPRGYVSVPEIDGPALKGLEKEPDFEDIATWIFGEFLGRPSERRRPWVQLFIMAVAKTSRRVEPVLLKGMSDVNSHDDLEDLCSLVGFDGSRIAYDHPNLIEAILKQARNLGAESFDRIQMLLVRGATPQARSYTNDVLNPEYAYTRPAAEKALKQMDGRALLVPFYQKIIEMEIASADRKRMRDEDEKDDWM